VVQITSFLLSVRGLEFQLFGGRMGLSCSHSGEHWVSMPCVGHQQSSGLPLSGRSGIPGLRQEKHDSPARRCSMKHWAFVYLGDNRASGAACSVADYSFPSLSGESGVFAL
jgi:hypothetical protein